MKTKSTHERIVDNSIQANQNNKINKEIKTPIINDSKNNYIKTQVLFIFSSIISFINL